MMEIPRLSNNEQHMVCLTCHARTIIGEKVFCLEEKIRIRPKLCPLPALADKSAPDVYAMLRRQIRNGKP